MSDSRAIALEIVDLVRAQAEKQRVGNPSIRWSEEEQGVEFLVFEISSVLDHFGRDGELQYSWTVPAFTELLTLLLSTSELQFILDNIFEDGRRGSIFNTRPRTRGGR